MKLAIVVPCYNEQDVLRLCNDALSSVLNKLISTGVIADDSYILYVDDGSTDATWSVIEQLATGSLMPHICGIKLTTNTGHQNALIAGLETVAGDCDAAISIDADLQDDVNIIPEMIARYNDGYDIVYGVRRNRKTDTWFKRESAQNAYRVMHRLGVNTIYNHADFRLMSAETIRDFLRYDERNIFIRGIVPGLGRRQTAVYFERKPRVAGHSKYPLNKMVNFAVDGITSHSVRPVRLVFCVGVIFLLVALGIFVYVMIRYAANRTIEGWTSLMLSIWFCSGILLISLGIVGEYVGKIYTEVKHRPRYSVEKRI